MKHSLLFIVAILILPSLAYAQVLKGKITDQSGKPIEYSTVYIMELRQGTTSNSYGDYEISLPKGNYMVTYQSLGYQPVTANITLSGSTIKNVVLLQQIYEIAEVRVTASGEDPAYGIMRKAIGLAPYYLNNVSYYKAEVYLKGNLVINKIPKLLQKSMKIGSNNATVSAGSKPKKEEKLLKAGDSFLMESMNEIEFTAPDKYFQKMISYNSTFPAEGNEISPMSFIQASFYQPVLADMAISPLAPNAFSHYNYKYLGASQQGNFTINKIQVIPKRKSQQLFEGTIYIVEDLWCLQSIDLTNDNLVGKIRVEQLYTPVQDDIWMPVSHKFEINIGIIGFKADAGYTSSVKYSEVKPNLTLQKPASLTAVFPVKSEIKPSDTIVSKSKQQINKILEKDKLSNRDMFKLSKLMEKESKSSVDSGKKSLEIKDRTTHTIEKDANKKDSTYWSKIRPIPLSEIELKSLRTSDSIKSLDSHNELESDTTQSVNQKKKSSFKGTVHDIVLGHTWSDTTGFRFSYNGLVDLSNLRFNSVDGFVYGLDFTLSKSWKKTGNSFSFVPDIRWAFSREKLIWGINSEYSFDKMKHQQIFGRAGVTSKDINNGGGINPFINSIYSLLLKENYLKLYESRFMTLGYRTEITNGLTIRISANYEDRRILQNTTNFSLLKSSKIYSPNIPGNPYLQPGSNEINQLRNQKHFDFLTDISYTPYQKYRINKGVKLPAGSDWPTFNLTWEHGFNDFSEINSGIRQLDMIRFEVSRSTTIGAFSTFKWRVRTAGFFDNRNLTFYDFFHINSQLLPILLNNYEDAFMIPSFYSLSTPEAYAEVHLKYTSPYLLLKLLPGLSNTLMRENLSFSYLGSRYHTNYSEVGYSISEILFIGELGIYAGFDDLKYRSVGLKAILKFN
jgi:hypothetical protein